jgi:hypothetical protein
MKKEIIIAIILGVFVGLAVTYGVQTANKAITEKTEKASPSPNQESTASAVNSYQSETKLSLQITSPDNHLVVKENNIEIKGTSKDNAFIAVLGEEDEVLTTADDDGFFATEIPLIKGINNIQVIASDRNNQQLKKEIEIVYSTAEIQ